MDDDGGRDDEKSKGEVGMGDLVLRAVGDETTVGGNGARGGGRGDCDCDRGDR